MSTVKLPSGKEVSIKRLTNQAQNRIRRGGAFVFKHKYKRANEKRIIEEEFDDWTNQSDF